MKKIVNLLMIAILFSATIGFSQVIYEEVVTSDGLGGMMAFKSTSKTFLTPTARRQTSKTEFTGSFLKHFNQNSANVDITRLDKELFWNIDLKKKQYTETTFAEIRKMFEKGMDEQAMPGQRGKPDEADEIDEDEYEWEKPVVKVLRGKKTKKINGFKCKRFVVKVIVVGKHKKTGIRDTMMVVNDMWNSVVVAKAMKQIQDFNKKMVKKMGMERPMQGLTQIFASYKEYFKEMSKEVEKLEGYPIRSKVKMTSTNHVQAASKKSASPEEDNTVDLSKNPMGGLLGGFAKKMMKQKTQKTQTSGAKQLFQFVTELKSLKMGSIQADKFQVPAGCKKIAKPKNPYMGM